MRVRRHLEPAWEWPLWTRRLRRSARHLWRRARHRRWVMLAGVGLTAFLLGYAFSALVLFPAPIFASSRSVPRLIALEEAAAIAALEQQNLRPGDIERAPHPDAPAGRVVWQDPPPGVGVPEGTIVRLVVSGGPQRIPVPDLVGYDAAIARELVDAAGLSLGRVDETQAPVPRGVVVASRPATGATLPPGGRVTLVVSAGAPTITVPQIVGLTPEEATTVLEEAGLTLGTSIRRTALGAQPGTIMEQTPAPGTLAAPGTAVNVIVARRRSP